MPPVFAHGRLRLYLLKLLDEAPRHGYEIIRLLEERFQGMYAPSAGTVYPRLAKLEAEGLVSHATEGGRKVYSITAAGRDELTDRAAELAELEVEIRESVAELAAEIREDVRGNAGALRREMREAAQRARTSAGGEGGEDGGGQPGGGEGAWGDREAWRQAKEELRRAREEWKEQARRAKEESRRARRDAQRAREQAQEAQERAFEEVQRIARRVQEQAQEHVRAGDWQRALREGLAEVSRGMSRLGRHGGPDQGTEQPTADRPGPSGEWAAPSGPSGERAAPGGPGLGKEWSAGEGPGLGKEWSAADRPGPSGGQPAPGGPGPTGEWAAPGGPGLAEERSAGDGTVEPEWAREFRPSGAPARDLDRLLDRFRDGIRDTARDHGVSDRALAEAHRALAATAARLDRLLREGPR
ncbi:PadR family transcriptional regulator [Streptomyces palmae]|uniref:PadR family transcriptional regulator n=1 Tax=Streptomyces palmae TaxID=1701085 RepID=A0A4Z0HCJ8_9ACTN|nr:PadR family transcriptional regulator [Streptomyces palmae]TGB14688.1 PadR family transcriptional regulator [Streptomyces palmae]